ncbi:sulfur carrier protein ThiS [Zobellia laminariae]|uniref:sulfur carrier protein ThiS n=1 Tax=Zobellia laminariae TaxID=248906 RepID=UPI0012D85CC3|nr:sulfur carrier protein ThiS [Zobellia laminariae]MUH41170.1 sulfur carrier protein ThiS [Zobellia laminariae]WKX76572.1 sulfur carrier protein ThiS [Zobellia laminariae]
MITIHMNQKRLEVNSNTTIYQFLKQIDSSVNGVAVAINEQVVSRHNWQTQELKDQDQVLVIQAAQGG